MEIPKQLKQRGIYFVLIEKEGKKPFEKDWQNKKIEYDLVALNRHITFMNGNYGVRGGGEKKLVIVDFDSEELQKKIIDKLPQTFTVKTGSGLLHKYFFSDGSQSFKIFDEELNTLADIQGEGKQVVGPGSIHPNGNPYEVVDESDISFIGYSELKALMMAHDKKPKKEIAPQIPKEYEGNNFLEQLKSALTLDSVLSDYGVDISKNPTNCPLHSSKGGKCLGFNDETWHCFHCEESGNIFSAVTKFKGCNFKEALEELVKKANLEEEYEQSKKEFAAQIFTKKRQAQEFDNLLPYFYDESGLWWLWNSLDYKWERSNDVNILNMISKITGADIITSKNRTEIINAMKQEGRKKIPKPINPFWIQFKDTLVDIKTGKERKATPEYFVTNPIPWKLNEERYVETPTIDRIFEEWVGADYVKTLYEILAYCLIPSYPLARIFCFLGEGMNGKSKYLEFIRRFVGDDNCCSTELDVLMQSRFEITRLHKKLVCQMGETDFEQMSKTSILKKLTGEDLIGFEFKNKDLFHEKNYAKILIATNNLPTTSDKTVGFYRRWLIVDFPNQFSEKKDILSDIPEEEYEILGVKLLGVLKDLLDKKQFNNEGNIIDRQKKYEAKSNFLKKFIEENCWENDNEFVTKNSFKTRFLGWCKENRHRELSDYTILSEMVKMGLESGKGYIDWDEFGTLTKKQVRVWRGLKWKHT